MRVAAFCNRDDQVRTAFECGRINGSDTVGKGDGSEAGAVGESIAFNRSDTVGDGDGSEAGAIIEGTYDFFVIGICKIIYA